MYFYKEIYYAIKEAVKSHDLPPVIWRPKKTGGVFFKGLRGREPVVYFPVQVWRPENLDIRSKTRD